MLSVINYAVTFEKPLRYLSFPQSRQSKGKSCKVSDILSLFQVIQRRSCWGMSVQLKVGRTHAVCLLVCPYSLSQERHDIVLIKSGVTAQWAPANRSWVGWALVRSLHPQITAEQCPKLLEAVPAVSFDCGLVVTPAIKPAPHRDWREVM